MKSELSKLHNSRWKRILPPLLIVCIIAYMDRVNISFAISGGMDKALGMTASIAGLASGIFFFGYLFLQVPAGQIAAKRSGKKVISIIVPIWAVISILSGLCTNSTQLLILRFILGIVEGGMLPVVLTMVSNWFPNEERGRANALVLMFAPIASIITGPISGYIISFSNWRFMFILEGILSLIVLIPWLILVKDRPEQAPWISDEEKKYILDSLKEEQKTLAEENNIKQASLKDLLPNTAMWKLIILNFCYQSGDYGFSMWLPTTLKKLTNSGMGMVGLLSSLPWIACIAGMLLFSKLSDRTGRRKEFVALPLIGFALCLLLSTTIHANVWISYIFLIGAGFFAKAGGVVFWAIPSRIFSKEVAGGARGAINALGNLGGFFGPYIVGFLIQYFNFNTGIYTLVVLLFVAAFIAATLPAIVQATVKKEQSKLKQTV
ncbi:2-ketogluconate transporter [Bacillus sp. AFS077874]|uniref:MFS transporter n=1 Tax=unclassified Bacillus (in: firmicutes) TaxID=185979 RepID=UPI000BECF618|nr:MULTISPECIES: MFS transporter [unclassified Bacillus (in: firmicutes)]PEC50982.1 2-ketogluconate transporter [Bacillus sp. AFS096315]PET76359.1 2-ketogluconate transporter [Bacillus sp. AFS001701]PFM83226.1 2-ketogluconate transporter [Bacillus sp. AFS077874]